MDKDDHEERDLDLVDPKFEARFQKVLDGIPPTPKKGDKIPLKQVAESVARVLRGDCSNREVSEEELQNALEWMGEREEERKQEQVVLLVQVVGLVVFVVAVLYVIFTV